MAETANWKLDGGVARRHRAKVPFAHTNHAVPERQADCLAIVRVVATNVMLLLHAIHGVPHHAVHHVCHAIHVKTWEHAATRVVTLGFLWLWLWHVEASLVEAGHTEIASARFFHWSIPFHRTVGC